MIQIMKRLRTSTQIALKFTIYFMAIFTLLWITLNGIFLNQRLNNEYQRIVKQVWTSPRNLKEGQWWRFRPNMPLPIITVDYQEQIIKELEENTIIKNITKIDETYIMYRIIDKKIELLDVSRPIEMQYHLGWITLIIILWGTLLTFALSRLFAQSSLQKINELVKKKKKLDIHNLTTRVPVSWPENDEIRIIASTLQKSLDTINIQTNSLKDFVSYASHELKTPLATIRWLVELWSKTNDIEKTGLKIKKTLTEMTNLLDTLLLITKREFSDIHKEKINIIPLVKQIEEEISWHYADKSIQYKTIYPKHYSVSWKSDIIKIILSNLLNNAYKFTPAGWIISSTIKDNIISIHNTGENISQEDQRKIRMRFWKKTTEHNDWFGLWLYMVKLLIEKLWRNISVKSELNKGTTFTITII